MATIRPNDNAPSGEAKYIFPTATFDLSPGGTYETEDRAVISAAQVHPWLEVEFPEAASVTYTRESRSVAYEDDVLAAPNSRAFDLDLIRATEEAKVGVTAAPLAVDAGLDQGKVEEVAGTNVTLAADDKATEAAETADDDDKPARRRRAAKED